MLSNNIIRIDENIYNDDYGKGSIFQNEIIISTYDGRITESSFRRVFIDKNLNTIAIEIPIKTDEKVLESLEMIMAENYLHKSEGFNITDYRNKFTVSIDSEKNKYYEALKDSKEGQNILNEINANKYFNMTNQELKDYIEI